MSTDTHSPSKPRHKRISWFVTIFVAALAAALVWHQGYLPFGKGATATAKNDEIGQRDSGVQVPAPVHATLVEQRDIPVILYGLGTAQAWNTVTVRSRVDGQIDKINFEEGQTVKEGDPLLQLDARPFIAARDQAKAKITQDEAGLKSAKADLARTASLSKDGYATKQLFDQQTGNVAQLTAQLESDMAALENADVQLKYTTITSPISGVVGLRNVDVGNIVKSSDAAGVVTVTQIDPMAVVFTAPEAQVNAITHGIQRAPLHVTAFTSDGKTSLAEGALAVVDNKVDAASGSIRLKGKFENSKSALWPGLSVATRLTVDTLQNVVVVPDAAVQRGPNGLFAYVINKDSKADLRELKVGQIQDGMAVIVSGLTAGEQVITSGHYKVQPGLPVKVLDKGPEKAQQRTAAKPVDKVID